MLPCHKVYLSCCDSPSHHFTTVKFLMIILVYNISVIVFSCMLSCRSLLCYLHNHGPSNKINQLNRKHHKTEIIFTSNVKQNKDKVLQREYIRLCNCFFIHIDSPQMARRLLKWCKA